VLPRSLKPEEIERLIDATWSTDVVGRRNYAMMSTEQSPLCGAFQHIAEPCAVSGSGHCRQIALGSVPRAIVAMTTRSTANMCQTRMEDHSFTIYGTFVRHVRHARSLSAQKLPSAAFVSTEFAASFVAPSSGPFNVMCKWY
jgi:hypothetical protein